MMRRRRCRTGGREGCGRGEPSVDLMGVSHTKGLAVTVGVKGRRWILNTEPPGSGDRLNVKEAGGVAGRALMWFSLKVRHGFEFQIF